MLTAQVLQSLSIAVELIATNIDMSEFKLFNCEHFYTIIFSKHINLTNICNFYKVFKNSGPFLHVGFVNNLRCDPC